MFTYVILLFLMFCMKYIFFISFTIFPNDIFGLYQTLGIYSYLGFNKTNELVDDKGVMTVILFGLITNENSNESYKSYESFEKFMTWVESNRFIITIVILSCITFIFLLLYGIIKLVSNKVTNKNKESYYINQLFKILMIAYCNVCTIVFL